MKKLFYPLIIALLAMTASCNKADEIDTIPENDPTDEVIYAVERFNLSILEEFGAFNLKTRAGSGVTVLPASYPIGITDIYVDPDSDFFPSDGGTVTVRAIGSSASPISVKAYNYLNPSEEFFNDAIPSGVNQTASFTIPPYYDPGDGNPRLIMIHYMERNWTYLHVYIQYPTEKLFQTDIDLYIPYEGDTYNIYAMGDVPTSGQMVSFRAVDTNERELGSGVIFPPLLPTGQITIPQNDTNDVRQVFIQYSMDNGTNWTTFETWLQLVPTGGSAVVKEGHVYEQFSPGGGSGRMYLIAGEGTDLSQVEFRAVDTYHPWHSPNGTNPVIIDGVYGTNTPISVGLQDYDGYLDVTVGASTPLNGWVHGLRDNIGFKYPQRVTTYRIEYNNNTEWIDIGEISQWAYYLLVYESTPIISPLGGLWRLKIEGFVPDGQVMFKAALADSHTNDVCFGRPSDSPVLDNTKPGTVVEINIDENRTGQNRDIWLWYTIDGGVTWSRCLPNDPLLQYWHFPTGYPITQETM